MNRLKDKVAIDRRRDGIGRGIALAFGEGAKVAGAT
jgi:hypothetical protein